MTSNKGNQIRKKMIKMHALTDVQKIAGLERFIHKEYSGVYVSLQQYILFTKGEDKWTVILNSVNEDHVRSYNISHPDLILSSDGKMIIVELDGPWHKLPPGKHDVIRNRRYKLNGFPCIIINEEKLADKLNLNDVKKLTQDQINKEFKERFDNMIKGEKRRDE